IAKGSVLYAPLARFCAADENIETPLGIKVINVRTGEFSLSQLEDEGNWTYINGDSLKWARPGID
ncbi:hypothetical protein, partial [Anaplasma marginale]|uniref:hypothetical protein n=1 Tax=Anaplasma marginale TaxID=770 RepID=UPI0005B308A3